MAILTAIYKTSSFHRSALPLALQELHHRRLIRLPTPRPDIVVPRAVHGVPLFLRRSEVFKVDSAKSHGDALISIAMRHKNGLLYVFGRLEGLHLIGIEMSNNRRFIECMPCQPVAPDTEVVFPILLYHRFDAVKGAFNDPKLQALVFRQGLQGYCAAQRVAKYADAYPWMSSH